MDFTILTYALLGVNLCRIYAYYMQDLCIFKCDNSNGYAYYVYLFFKNKIK